MGKHKQAGPEYVFEIIKSFFFTFWHNGVKIFIVNARTVCTTACTLFPEWGHSDFGRVIYCVDTLPLLSLIGRNIFMGYFNLLKTCFLPHVNLVPDLTKPDGSTLHSVDEKQAANTFLWTSFFINQGVSFILFVEWNSIEVLLWLEYVLFQTSLAQCWM